MRIRSSLLIALALLSPLHPADAQSLDRSGREASADLWHRSFDMVWTTVKEKHFDPTLGGVDWDKVRSDYEPRLATLKSDKELYDLLQQMLGELKQSHFGIVPPDAIADDTAREPRTGGVGIDLRLIDRRIAISRVEADSPASKAGLRPGYILEEIDNSRVTTILNRFDTKEVLPNVRPVLIVRSVMTRVDGEPGSSVQLKVLDGGNRPKTVSLQRNRRKGEMSPRFGNFPPQYTEFESRRLENNIGYIRFNIFVTPLMEKLRSAVKSMLDASGIIIDLRGNPGGVGGISAGLGGLLTSKQFKLGTMTLRAATQHFVCYPQKDAYTGPVVILIDGLSASTSEVFAAGMQEAGRATVVGEKSAGAALPSIFTKLPTGALFQYAIADFRTPKGQLIEGQGVDPDVEVKLTRAGLLSGIDLQLEAAITRIKKISSRSHSRAA